MPATAVTRWPREVAQWALLGRVAQQDGRAGDQTEAMPGPAAAVVDHQVDRGEPAGRLAQRSGRQAAAIAQAALAVDHGDLQVARQSIVLESVVAQQQVAAEPADRQFAVRHPVRAGDHRADAPPGEQERLVSRPGRGHHPARPPAAIGLTGRRSRG